MANEMKMKMKMAEKEADAKAQLVADICSISSTFAACTHRRGRRSPPPGKNDFIDWYLVLRVDEDVGIEAIRRRYRQLALQLHPDKNRHPKAEAAFKLVSEAYGCLSDTTKREAFNSERLDKLCKECQRKKSQPSQPKTQYNSQYNTGETHHHHQQQQARWRESLKALREVQKRLQEECRVIERCLQANQASRTEDFPLFDPSNCMVYPNYPHQRSRVVLISSEYNGFHSRDVRHLGRKRCESPLYELRPDC